MARRLRVFLEEREDVRHTLGDDAAVIVAARSIYLKSIFSSPMAAIQVLVLATDTAVSAAPWVTITGIISLTGVRRSAALACMANAAGAIAPIAAQFEAYFEPRYSVPAPPMECPIRYVRLLSTLNSLRMISRTFITSFSLSSRRFDGSLAAAGIGFRLGRRAGSRSTGGSAVPSSRVVAHRPDENVAALFCEIDRVAPHQRVLIAAESMQGDDQGILFVFHHFGGNEDSVGQVFIRVMKVIGALLNPRIGRRLMGPLPAEACLPASCANANVVSATGKQNAKPMVSRELRFIKDPPLQNPVLQVKFAASSVLPVPLYLATSGYWHSALELVIAPVWSRRAAVNVAGALPSSTQLRRASNVP